MAPHDIYLTNQALIERALALVCHRQRLDKSDADDYCSAFRLHLMEDHYAAIRAFRGRSSLQTYLVVVMTRFYQDWRNARWGKWRPSAEARRMGAVAIRLETLVVRDGLTLGEAFEVLRPQLGPEDTLKRLETLAGRFGRRRGRATLSDTALGAIAAVGHEADGRLARRNATALAERASQALDEALAGFPPEDRILLRMRFEDDVPVADIAKRLRLDQKRLYRRIDRLLVRLRRALATAGLDAAAAAEVVHHRGFDGPDEPAPPRWSGP